MLTERCLSTGTFGLRLETPSGDVVNADDESGLTILDAVNDLQWSLKFFDNLHMDLSHSTRQHLNDAIHRFGKSIFEERFRQAVGGFSTMRPRTQDDPDWSPIIDIEYINIESEAGLSTPALMVVHRTAYRAGEQIVMGRLFLPVRRGLFEVIVMAGERGTGWRESSIVAERCKDETMTAERLESLLRDHDFDSPCYDEQFPAHCLSRVRKAMSWLMNESTLVVTEVPIQTQPREVDLTQLRCRLVPPPRFVYCPNPANPESNKQRFCRASFGGTDGVQMMVVSCWYGRNIRKGIKALRPVALHAARVIHESQQFVNIRISPQDISLNRRRWLGGASKDAVITIVDCEEVQGIRRQNTIGWIREAHSGIIYLVYFVDTLGLNRSEVQKELLETLSSIHVPRSNPRRALCSPNAWQALQHESPHPSHDLSTSSLGTQTV